MTARPATIATNVRVRMYFGRYFRPYPLGLYARTYSMRSR